MLIQGPGGFGGWVAYSDFTVPNLGIAYPLFFSLCLPQVYFLDRSGLLLGGAGPSMLDSILGMDYPLFPWVFFELVGLHSPGLIKG